MPRLARHVPALTVVAAVAFGLVTGACAGTDAGDTATGAGSGATATDASGSSSTSAIDPSLDFEATAADFVHLDDMTRVRDFFVTNALGMTDEAVAVAESPTGGVYPVGTIIQLVPQEAMVKRRAGYDPEFADWEFFVLEPTPEGTVITTRGGSEVLNRFGGSCAACHAKAEVEFDMVCEEDHGCDPLPIGQDMFDTLRAADPRPRATTGSTP